MADSQLGELLLPGDEKRTASYHKSTRLQLDQTCEDSIEITFGAGLENMKLQAELAGGLLHICSFDIRIAGVDEITYDCRLGYQFVQQLQPLLRYLNVQLGYARDVAAWLVELYDQASRTGSPPISKTIGMVAVAALATIAAGVAVVTITAT